MIRYVLHLAPLLLAASAWASSPGEEVWTLLQPGLELARFDSQLRRGDEDGDLVVVRIDPARWDLRILQPGEESDPPGSTLSEWCRRSGAVVAINAGMYQADLRTHVGFVQIDGAVVNPGVNDYQSALACDPVDPAEPPFGIFDLDTTSLGDLTGRYRTVVQNLRLVKHDGENRWQPLGSRWAEAAVGEDARGRALLIYCSTARSMYAFIEILLELPLDLVAAQHLEGRSQARLHIEVPGAPAQSFGRPLATREPVIPNVLGVFAPAAGPRAEERR